MFCYLFDVGLDSEEKDLLDWIWRKGREGRYLDMGEREKGRREKEKGG